MVAENALVGVVKSYNGAKGFGFISCEAVGGDVMFGRADLPADMREVQGKFLEGQSVIFVGVPQPDGRFKAQTVQMQAKQMPGEGELLAGVIKNFSDKNGWGFIESSCSSGDVRFDRKISPVAPGTNPIGMHVLFTYQVLSDGKLRADSMKLQSGKRAKDTGMQVVGAWGGQQNAWGGMKGGGGKAAAMQVPAWGGQQVQMQKGAMMKGQKGGGGWQNAAAAGGVGGTQVTGTVKTFSEKNGYGFLSVPNQQQDVKFGKADIVSGSTAPGTMVRAMLHTDEYGRMSAKQVVQVQAAGKGGVKRPMENAMGGAAMKTMRAGSGLKVETYSTGQWLAGTVKSFSQMKGFGFIGSAQGDVFFMKTDLADSSQAEAISAGCAVEYELVQTTDMKLRAQNVGLA